MTHTARAGVLFCLLTLSFSALSQIPDKVGSLLSADRAAARISASEGPHQALLSIADRNSIVFSRSAVNALEYLNNRPNIPDVLTWRPTFAAISKSMEWGVTSGSIAFQRVGAVRRYGEYLTIWKRDRKGIWKIALRAQVEHHGESDGLGLTLIEPNDAAYVKHRSEARLQQRKDIILSNDKLFSTVLRSNNELAYEEFLADDARLLLPWQSPKVGKASILDFLKEQDMEVITEPEQVDRSYSGELAYSYGSATVTHRGQEAPQAHNYVRIWQLQPDFQWRVIIELLFER